MTSPLCPRDLGAGAPALAAPISSVGPQHPSGFWQKCGERAGPRPISLLFREWGHGLSLQEVMEKAGQILERAGAALEQASMTRCVLPNPSSRERSRAPRIFSEVPIHRRLAEAVEPGGGR